MASSYLGRILRLPVPGQPVLAPPRWLMRRPEAGELAPGAGSARPAEAPPPDLAVARRPKPQAAVRRERTDEALAGPSTAAADDDMAGRGPAVATPTAIAGPGPAPRPAGVPPRAAQRTRNAASIGTPDAIHRATADATARTGVDASEPGATNLRRTRVPAAGPAAVQPAAPAPQAPPRTTRGERESGVRIGTIEVVVTPPPPPAAPGPTASSPGRHATARAPARLSRGFPSGFGLRQG